MTDTPLGPSPDPWPAGDTGNPIAATDLAALGFVSREQPRTGSITVLPLMRVELRPGETYTNASDHKVTSRAEAYGRVPDDRTLPPAEWLDPPGAVRWYDTAVFFPADFPVTRGLTWLTFTQWKGLTGGNPPIALEVKRSHLRLGGARTNAGLVPTDGHLGPIAFGAWTRLTVGLCLSPDPAEGWVTVYRDGVLALPQVAVATLDTDPAGAPDPVYFKQGLYRSRSWTETHVLFFAPTSVTEDRPGDLADR